MRLEKLLNALTVVLAACALVVTGLFARRELLGRREPATDAPVQRVEEWRAYAHGSRMGPDSPRVTIVEFSDFQCPFCASLQPALARVRARHPDAVAIVYRHFPLGELHPHAHTAARAAECAGEQGRFQAYHDALFDGQKAIGRRAWEAFAREARVPDVPAFRACMQSGRTAQRVRVDVQAAAKLGIRGTPALLVNDQLVVGPGPEQLDQLVTEALGRHAGNSP